MSHPNPLGRGRAAGNEIPEGKQKQFKAGLLCSFFPVLATNYFFSLTKISTENLCLCWPLLCGGRGIISPWKQEDLRSTTQVRAGDTSQICLFLMTVLILAYLMRWYPLLTSKAKQKTSKQQSKQKLECSFCTNHIVCGFLADSSLSRAD